MKTGMFPNVKIKVRTTIEVNGITRWECERTRDIPSTMDEAQGVLYLIHWGMDAALDAVGMIARKATLAVRDLEVSR